MTTSLGNCELGVSEINFFGLKLSASGVALGDNKIEALLNAADPETQSELSSFLGLAVYAANYIQDLATLAKPLWDLSKTSGEFKFDSVHSDAIKSIKKALTTKALGYFNIRWLTELHTDASPIGLSLVCVQVNPENSNDRKIITYGSRTLTDVERRYSQVEKEALAIVWACEKMSLRLLGSHFKIVTDNRAAQLIFSNPESKPPARIERWALRLMSFDYEIVHKAGKNNIADYMSRHPMENLETRDFENMTERYINFISEHSMPKAITREVLVAETVKDESLSQLKRKLEGSILNEQENGLIRKFDRLINEFSTTQEGLVLRGRKIVVPEVLVDKVLKIAHEGHLGIVKTKSLIRTKVWFPDLDKRVENLIKTCFACQLEGKATYEPIKSTELPDAAWDHLCMDFYGVPNNGELMVVMDEYSRFPMIEEVKSTASEHVIPALDSIFSVLGIPSVLKTDNGPPFNGHRFKEYSEYMGFKHRKITPLAPQANGQAENFMKNLGKVIRYSMNENKNWREEINKFLRNYRSTPHTTTGQPPSFLMFSRNNACRLPRAYYSYHNDVRPEVRSRDALAKLKSKTYTDKHRRAKTIELNLGDEVIAKQKRNSKWKTRFGPEVFIVKATKGSMITVRNSSNTKEFTRDRSYFKKRSWEVSKGNEVSNNDEFDTLSATNTPSASLIENEEHFVEPITNTEHLEIRSSKRQRYQTQRYQAGQSGLEKSIPKETVDVVSQ